MSAYEKRARAQQAKAVVGIDAGKRKHAMVIRPKDGRDTSPFMFAATRSGFEAAIAHLHLHVPSARPCEVLVAIEFAGYYGFTLAHYLRGLAFDVVSVLPKHTKQWKHVYHNQGLKSDAADAETITDLAAQGSFVTFPFMRQEYADLRYLVSQRERLTKLRGGAITRLKDVLQVVWPEFEQSCGNFNKATPLAILKAFPGPHAFLKAGKRRVLSVISKSSRGHHGEELYAELLLSAKETVALPGAQGCLKEELAHQIELIEVYEKQIETVEGLMSDALGRTPEAESLLSIPKLGAVAAAVFLGSIGDPRAYESYRQVLRVGGLSLITRTASGSNPGVPHLSKSGRPEMRRQMYMFAVRSVSREGVYRAYMERALRKNPKTPKKKVLVAIAREATRMMFKIALERRPFTAEAPRHRQPA